MILENLTITSSKKEEIFEMKPDYPYVIRRLYTILGKPVIAPWHWHEELEIIYVKEGSLAYHTPQGKVNLTAGEGIFLNSNVLHQVLAPLPTKEVSYDIHMFRRNFLAEENSLLEQKYIKPLLQMSSASFVSLTNAQPAHIPILKHLVSLSELQLNTSFGYELTSRNIMSEIWLQLVSLQNRCPSPASPVSRQKELRLKEMLLFVQEHYMDSLSLKDIAAAAAISERECLRCFQELLHTSPFMYLQEYRIQTACSMLKNSSDKIVDIATKCGFNSSSYFGKVFQRQMNCSPFQYRKQS